MSIPPLVCSTPPPPDQCEEDKEPDEFGIPYGLSQDDDDDEDGYNYGDFSSYNHYSTNCIAQKKEILSISVEPTIPNDTKEETNVIEQKNQLPTSDIPDSVFGTNTPTEKTKSDEDINLEDLCLELNEESLSSNEKEDDKSETGNDILDSEKVLEDNVSENNTNSSPSAEHVEEISSIENLKEIIDDPVEDLPVDTEVDALPSEPTTSNEEIPKKYDNEDPKPTEPNLDDDFEDYNDFQFVSTERKASDVIENCDNPWDSNESTVTNDFGNFTANFDAIESVNQEPITEHIEKVDNAEFTAQSNVEEDDDDFGDFDDFKSSSIDKQTGDNISESETSQNLPVLNLQSSDNEHQVMESITKVLGSIFEEEIKESETEFEDKLETMLSETWRHLRETDVRQPYILNWNNSLGQKTLLRALCIDSRNILFGPKWSYNMPKYAVNLSAAPLQPQKPLTPSNPSQSEVTSKNKPGTWSDPFTADGQEFTYAEALLLDLEHLMATLDQMAHNHSTLKISELLSHACSTEKESVVEVTATDLDVFEAAISKKSDKIYSSTLNVQPLRQISLPDTHIFTPTDSETPTSKTVHYNNGPPILLPQTSVDGSKTESSKSAPDKDDDDYWEFQDFKSSTEKSSTSIPTPTEQEPIQSVSEPKMDDATLKPNITYQTQVLQPIKMEPLMPTVNWPDPGHIKETFDDFSDFVSNSSWNDKPQAPTQVETKSEVGTSDNTDKIIENHKDEPVSNTVDVDDDFDTFQSALPAKHITSEFNFDSLTTKTFSNIPQESQMPDFNAAFPNVNSENISVNSFSESLKPSVSLNVEIPAFKGPVIGNTSHSLLQPISSNSKSQTHQKSGQILQPLSLESYSQINWPNPGIDLQDLSRFNPVETLHSLKSDLSVGGPSKGSSPVHSQKNANNQGTDDDWGEFVSSRPKQATLPKKAASFVDDDEWTDFVSSPSVKPQNGLNTISLNVHTNSNIQKSNNKLPTKGNQMPVDIPSLNYITTKTSGNAAYNDRHFQNL